MYGRHLYPVCGMNAPTSMVAHDLVRRALDMEVAPGDLYHLPRCSPDLRHPQGEMPALILEMVPVRRILSVAVAEPSTTALAEV